MAEDLSLQVLQKIHQEIQETNTRLGSLGNEVKETNARLDSLEKTTDSRFKSLEKTTDSRFKSLESRLHEDLQEVRERLDTAARRQTESEMRLATEVIAVSKDLGEVKDLLNRHLDNQDRFEHLEQRVAFLEKKVG